MGGYAWVTLATNDSYSLGALVLAHSLKKSNTAHKLAVMITPAVTQPMRNQLESVFDVVKLVDVLDSKDEAHLGLMKRPELGVTFTKIHCWKFTEFDKCVFLDADTLVSSIRNQVVRNCDELFEREEFSAAPDVSWPDCFNSGVFVFKPSVETFNKLLQFAMDNGSFDGGDQGLLNQFFSDWATKDIKNHLPFVYNLTSIAVYSYIPAFKHYGSDTRIVHFIGTGKPWLQQLNPVTKTITPTHGSEHLTPLLQKWWDIFCEKVHPFMNKNLDISNGISQSSVEACLHSNLLIECSEVTKLPPRFFEPKTPYREENDFRQSNLPYRPSDVLGPSGELLNEGFSLITANDSEFVLINDENRNESNESKNEGNDVGQAIREMNREIKTFNFEKEYSHLFAQSKKNDDDCEPEINIQYICSNQPVNVNKKSKISNPIIDYKNNNACNVIENKDYHCIENNFNKTMVKNGSDNAYYNFDCKYRIHEAKHCEQEKCKNKLLEEQKKMVFVKNFHENEERNFQTETSVTSEENALNDTCGSNSDPKSLFHFDNFFPDDNCVNDYLEHKFRQYQLSECHVEKNKNIFEVKAVSNETPAASILTSAAVAAAINNDVPNTVEVKNDFDENRERRASLLPRFLTMPESDERQCGNCPSTAKMAASVPITPLKSQSKEVIRPSDAYAAPKNEKEEVFVPSAVQKTERIVPTLPKSKSMSQLVFDVNSVESFMSTLYFKSAESSPSTAVVDCQRKYSMPKLKPLLPKKDPLHKSHSAVFPKVTLYTEFLMSSDYKDPVDLPLDKEGFVENHIKKDFFLKRSKSEASFQTSKFGPLSYADEKKSLVEHDEKPHKPWKSFIDLGFYDLKNCKRQMGNKPKPMESRSETSKSSSESLNFFVASNGVPRKKKKDSLSASESNVCDGKSQRVKKPGKTCEKVKKLKNRKSFLFSSSNVTNGDIRKESSRDSCEEVKSVGEILKKLFDFSKNYLHYFGDSTNKGESSSKTKTNFICALAETPKDFSCSLLKSNESENVFRQSDKGKNDLEGAISKEGSSQAIKFEKFRNYVQDRKQKVQEGLLGLQNFVDFHENLHRKRSNTNNVVPLASSSLSLRNSRKTKKENGDFCKDLVAYDWDANRKNKIEKRKKLFLKNQSKNMGFNGVIPLPWYSQLKDCSHTSRNNLKHQNGETFCPSPIQPCILNSPTTEKSKSCAASVLNQNNKIFSGPETKSFPKKILHSNYFPEGSVASYPARDKLSGEKLSKSFAVCNKANEPANTFPVSAANVRNFFVEPSDGEHRKTTERDGVVSDNDSGIAGAIAQLSLETENSSDSPANSHSSAHQEYLRRQNWETGNMDYMGKDSFDNIWSKICQTLEEKGVEESKMNLGPTQSTAEISSQTSKVMPQSTSQQATGLQPKETAKLPSTPVAPPTKMPSEEKKSTDLPNTKDGAPKVTAQTQPVSSVIVPNETKTVPAKMVSEEQPVSADVTKKPVVPSAPTLSSEFLKLGSADASQALTPVEKITAETSAAPLSSQSLPMQGPTLKDSPPKRTDNMAASQTKSDNSTLPKETVPETKSFNDVSVSKSQNSPTPEVSSLVTHFAASEITSATLLPPQIEKKNEPSKNNVNQTVEVTKTPLTPTEPCVEEKDFSKQVVLPNKKTEASEPKPPSDQPSKEMTRDVLTDKKGTAVVPYCDVFQTAKDAQATKPHHEKDSLRKAVEETIKKQSEAKTDQFPPIPMPESPTKIQPPTVGNISFSVEEHSQELKKDEPKIKKGVISKILDIVGVGSRGNPEDDNELFKSIFCDRDKTKEQKEVSMPSKTKTDKQMKTTAQNLAPAEAQENSAKSKKSKKFEKPESASLEADKSAKDVTNDNSKAKDKKNSKNNKNKGPKPSAPSDTKKDLQTETNKVVETGSPKDVTHPPQAKGNQKEKPKAKGDKKENSGGKKGDKEEKGEKAKPSEQSLSSPQDGKTSNKKSPSPTLSITQPATEDANKPEKPKTGKNLAFLTIDDSIPDTPPATESKESGDSASSVEGKLLKEIDDLIEKAKVVAESQIQSLIDDENQNEKKLSNGNEKSSNKSGKGEQNKQKCQSEHSKEKKGEQKQVMHSPSAQPEKFEELKVTSEEDRKKHKSEPVTSKLSDQILKAIPPPRRKAFTDSKAGGGSGAGSTGPKKPEEVAAPKPEPTKHEKPHVEPPKSGGGGGGGGNQKSKGGADPVPPPRNRSKPRQKTPPKGKPKK